MGKFGSLLSGVKRAFRAAAPAPTAQELARIEEHYREAASVVISELLDACRSNDGPRGGHIAKFIYESNDLNLLVMVLGILSSTVVGRESEIQLRGMSLEQLNMLAVQADEPWITSAMDQLSAAAENFDYQTFAQVAVQSHLKAISRDRERFGEMVDFDYVQRALSAIDQNTLTIIAAQSLLQLSNCTTNGSDEKEYDE